MSSKNDVYEEIIESALLQKPGSEQEEYLIRLAKSLDSLSEEDLLKWIAANKSGLSQYMPKDSKVWKVANGPEPNWQNKPIDLEKLFNDEEILYHWKEMDPEQIETVAEMNGISKDRLKAELETQSVIQHRKDNMWPEWAWGHSVMNPVINGLQKVFTPRLYEKRLREGVDTPLFTDDKGNFDPSLLLDVGESALYAVPYGKIGSMVKPVATVLNGTGKASKAAKTGMYLFENTANPFIMEVADDIAYDDPENERSNFSWTDVATGAGVNMGAPMMLKGGAVGINRILSGSGKPDRGLLKMLYDFGEGSAENVLQKIQQQNKKFDELSAKVALNGKSDLDAMERAFLESYPRNELNDEILEQIMLQPGKSFQEKVGKYMQSVPEGNIKMLEIDGGTGKNIVERKDLNLKNVPNQEKVKRSSEAILPILEESPYKILDDKTLKSQRQILEENGIKNFITNKYGDVGYDKERASNLPLIGGMISVLKDRDEKELERAAKANALDNLRVHFMLGE